MINLFSGNIKKMELKSHINETIEKINSDICYNSVIIDSRKILEQLKETKKYNDIIDTILIIYKYNYRGVGIIPELREIERAIDDQERQKDACSKIYEKYKLDIDKYENDDIGLDFINKYNNSYSVLNNEKILINDIIYKVIHVLKNNKMLDSDFTIPVFNMFESLENFFTDDDKYKYHYIFSSISQLFIANGWSNSGFSTCPQREILLSGLEQISELLSTNI